MKFLNAVRHICLTPRYFGILFMLLLALSSCVHPPRERVDNAEKYSRLGWPKPNQQFQEKELPIVQVSYPVIADAEYVKEDDLCMTCHKTYAESFAHNVHRKNNCEDCHGPASRHLETQGKEPGLILSFKNLQPAQASELCLKCHEKDACKTEFQWRTSVHANEGVTCINCHRAHYNIPLDTPATTLPGDESASIDLKPIIQTAAESEDDTRPSLRGTSYALGAIEPGVCYRCHDDKHQLETIAGPHQIGGKNGFACTTCHDSHGRLLDSSRTDLCMQCHQGMPTSAWHSSSHAMAGVACVDCHNPHPDSTPQRFVNISHTQVDRPNRMPMSVNDPEACYKCHTDIYAKNAMPSHHPIKEGKMQCGDCHDAHGQAEGNLKDVSVNMVCWKCHAEKQGPFVYEHPPVTENCDICHDPHGTVANQLLKQPATFLCLRCHTGHRIATPPHGYGGSNFPDLGTTPALQKAFFTDCTQCHQQIHGSDLQSPHNNNVFFR